MLGERRRLRRAIKLSNALDPAFLSSSEEHILRLCCQILPGKLDYDIHRDTSLVEVHLPLMLNSFPGHKDNCVTALKLARDMQRLLKKKLESINENIRAFD